MRYSFGVNKWDTLNGEHADPVNYTGSWDDYLDLLRDYARIERHSIQKETSTPWTSPMLLDASGRRTLDNVVRLGAFAAVDLDTPGWTLDRLNETFAGFNRALHTTTKSRPEQQRWRVIIELDREITVEEHYSVWRFLNEVLNGDLDKKTRNHNRILYVPAKWLGADNILANYNGVPLNVDGVIEYCPIEPRPEKPALAPADLKQAPPDTGIITAHMANDFLGQTTRNGRYYAMLTRAAVYYRKNGWTLTPAQLDDAAMAIARLHSNPGDRRDHLHDAEQAIKWAAENVPVPSQMERVRSLLKYQEQRRLNFISANK